MQFAKVTRALLEAMADGESRIVLEAGKAAKGAPGKLTQSYANRAGYKVTTRACLIVIPSDDELHRAVLVTRIS